MIKLNQIKINSANPRLIKDDRFKKLVQSVKEFPKMMALRPIIIDDDGTILGGNMRYRALISLGYKEIPDEWVRKASELTDEEKQRFIIEDNVSFGEWDYEKLANEWDDALLEEWGMDIQLTDKDKLDIGEAEVGEKEVPDDMTKCPKCGFEWKE
jgi:ParB-like chromosome segregation protein Spo0J